MCRRVCKILILPRRRIDYSTSIDGIKARDSLKTIFTQGKIPVKDEDSGECYY
jgi:hypothetical protein